MCYNRYVANIYATLEKLNGEIIDYKTYYDLYPDTEFIDENSLNEGYDANTLPDFMALIYDKLLSLTE